MKKIIILLVLGCTFLACNPKGRDLCQDDIYMDDSQLWLIVHEEVAGVVTNEEGDSLQGILIKKYLDRDLSQEALNQKIYSNAEGKYCLGEITHYPKREINEFFLSVIDPADVYEPQTIPVQVKYVFSNESYDYDVIAQAEVNIVMTKK